MTVACFDQGTKQSPEVLESTDEKAVSGVGSDVSTTEVASSSVPASGEISSEGKSTSNGGGVLKGMANAANVSLGPISLSFGDDFSSGQDRTSAADTGEFIESDERGESISSMTNEEWQEKYEIDGCVDLWVKEEFNAGSRLMVSGMV